MKALYFKEHGELDVIQYGDVPDSPPLRARLVGDRAGQGAGAGNSIKFSGHLGAAGLARLKA